MVSVGCMGTNRGIHEYMYGVSQQIQEEEKGQEESNEDQKATRAIYLCVVMFWFDLLGFGVACPGKKRFETARLLQSPS